jgi:bifunctional non-homologous end joining protein LigD
MLVAQVPAGDEWLPEIKFDGYRTGARIAPGGEIRMMIWRGLDWMVRFRPVADAPGAGCE